MLLKSLQQYKRRFVDAVDAQAKQASALFHCALTLLRYYFSVVRRQ